MWGTIGSLVEARVVVGGSVGGLVWGRVVVGGLDVDYEARVQVLERLEVGKDCRV